MAFREESALGFPLYNILTSKEGNPTFTKPLHVLLYILLLKEQLVANSIIIIHSISLPTAVQCLGISPLPNHFIAECFLDTSLCC